MKTNEMVILGTVSIRRDDKKYDSEHGEAYTIFIFRGDDDKEYESHKVYSFDFDRVILEALSLKHERSNGAFGHYAALMLELNGEIWT